MRSNVAVAGGRRLSIVNTSPVVWVGLLSAVTDNSIEDEVQLPTPFIQEASDEVKTCSICLEELQAGASVQRSPVCDHEFHEVCMRTWLDAKGRSCPMCRASLVPTTSAPTTTLVPWNCIVS